MKSLKRVANSLLILSFIFFTGCFDFSGSLWEEDSDDNPPNRTNLTEILHVEIKPNPVIAGDSVAFTYFIEDSLDTAFYFKWHILPKDTLWERTEEKTFKIKAPNEPGFYDGTVIAAKDLPYYSAPFKKFTYEVIEKEG